MVAILLKGIIMKFRDLQIGQSFDFINDSDIMKTSFFKRCIKISGRKYIGVDNVSYTIGSINANVFHIDENVYTVV